MGRVGGSVNRGSLGVAGGTKENIGEEKGGGKGGGECDEETGTGAVQSDEGGTWEDGWRRDCVMTLQPADR